MSRQRAERARQARRQAELRARKLQAVLRAQQAETRGRWLPAALSWIVLAVVTGFLVANLRPALWFADTTPTGGDLGAHVWGAAYLRDVLLGELRLTGWSHDWYAGFPAFGFYMVMPFLIVVIVNAGTGLPVAFLAHVAAVGAALAMLRVPAARRYWVAIPARLRVLPAGALAAAAIAVVQFVALAVSDVTELLYQPLAVLGLPGVAAWWSWTALERRPRWRLLAAVSAALAALLVVPVPYGVSLKLVSIAGVAALPAAVWVVTRMSGVAPQGQALATAASLLFLFDRSHNIYGGNLMSTMAGEFAFSLGLAGAVLYIGVAVRGLRDGGCRVLAGVLLALTGLLHLFTAFFALAVTAALLVTAPCNASARWRRIGWMSAVVLLVLAGVLAGVLLTGLLAFTAVLVALAATVAATLAWWRDVKWVIVTGLLSFTFSAWWVLPFWWNRSLLNDMGWGKDERYVSALWSRSKFDYGFLTNDPRLQLFVVLAVLSALGFVAAGLWQASQSPRRPASRSRSRRSRQAVADQRQVLSPAGTVGVALALTAVAAALVFRFLPEGRLWNVRILPFYYLAVYLVAGLGVGEALRRLAGFIDRRVPSRPAEFETRTAKRPRPSPGVLVSVGLVVVSVAAVLVMVGMPLRSLPGGSLHDDGKYRWGPFSTAEVNLGPHWLQYNYSGYERQGAWPEYREMVDLMAEIGETHGCGPALWEYSTDRLGSYGTPMAPMLLPFWTDGCIGSQEGLYFEASATTPYHFLMQSELSEGPSRAQRDLPYDDLNVAQGVEHLRMMGVRYYMASSGAAVSQAFNTPGLTEIAVSSPWAVFEVDRSEPVSGLERLPVVLEGMEMSEDSWLVPSVGAFLAGLDGPVLAAEGPPSWPRLSLDAVMDMAHSSDPETSRADEMRRVSDALVAAAPVSTLEPAVVSDVVRRDHSISFSVDRIGSPVLVRTSYFPNWSVSGADGPYRVTPNFMVVVPTSTEVRLTYGRSLVEWFATLLALAGIVAAFWLHRRDTPTPVADDPGEAGGQAGGEAAVAAAATRQRGSPGTASRGAAAPDATVAVTATRQRGSPAPASRNDPAARDELASRDKPAARDKL